MKTRTAAVLDAFLYKTPRLLKADWNKGMCEKCHVVKPIPPKTNYDNNTNLLNSLCDTRLYAQIQCADSYDTLTELVLISSI